jgi:hypothetical protein
MRRRLVVVLMGLAGSVLCSSGNVAAGGGATIEFPQAVEVGQTVTGSGTFSDGSQEPVRAGPWFARLDPEAGGVAEVPLGTVTITHEDGNWRASVTFVVPDVPTGAYSIWVSNAEGKGVGDLTGGWTVIGQTLTEAQQFVQLRATAWRLKIRDRKIGTLEAREEQLLVDLADRGATIERQAERLAAVGARVTTLKAELAALRANGEAPTPVWPALLGGAALVAITVTAFVVGRGRGRNRAPDPNAGGLGDAHAGDGREAFMDAEPGPARVG